MRKVSAAVVLGLFFGAGMGCSSDDKVAATTDAAPAGGMNNAALYAMASERLACSSPGAEACKEADFTVQTQCLAPKCAAAYVECFGADYAKGTYTGVCGAYMGCVGLCACGDTACRSKCPTPAAECLGCLIGKVVTCAGQNAMACPAPACQKSAGGPPMMGMPDAGAKP